MSSTDDEIEDEKILEERTVTEAPHPVLSVTATSIQPGPANVNDQNVTKDGTEAEDEEGEQPNEELQPKHDDKKNIRDGSGDGGDTGENGDDEGESDKDFAKKELDKSSNDGSEECGDDSDDFIDNHRLKNVNGCVTPPRLSNDVKERIKLSNRRQMATAQPALAEETVKIPSPNTPVLENDNETNESFDDEYSLSGKNINNKNSSTNNTSQLQERITDHKMARGKIMPGTTGSSPDDAETYHMSFEDIDICEKLDEEYEKALEEREIGYAARYQSVRQSACFSVSFMVILIVVGTVFVMKQTALIDTEEKEDHEKETVPIFSFEEALLFNMYTITTVGYGQQDLPKTAAFQLFFIFYIFIGIATLTIMVAQVYQLLALEAARAQHAQDKRDMAEHGKNVLNDLSETSSSGGGGVTRRPPTLDTIHSLHEYATPQNNNQRCCWRIVRSFNRAKRFFKEDPIGHVMSILFPFTGLIAIGACVVGPIEGWGVIESIYFAVVSLTTVGYGTYMPSHPASVWFTIFYLPFSIGFMSLFLGRVAKWYIHLSDNNIRRIERSIRRQFQKQKEWVRKEAEAARRRAMRGQESSDIELGDGVDHDENIDDKSSRLGIIQPKVKRGEFDSLPSADENDSLDDSRSHRLALFGTPGASADFSRHREMVLARSRYGRPNSTGGYGDVTLYEDRDSNVERSQPNHDKTMLSMMDVIRTVKTNLISSSDSSTNDSSGFRKLASPEQRFMSKRRLSPLPINFRKRLPVTQSKGMNNKKPSFALRVLVQERFAEIIATDIAGYQCNVEIHENTLSVTIDSLKTTADKWLIPTRARKAFRAVSFEALYFVGEHSLITRGADALYDLSPFEFHGLFSPLLAAMGDAETMDGWLASTDVLAEVDLRRDSMVDLSLVDTDLNPKQRSTRKTKKTKDKLDMAHKQHAVSGLSTSAIKPRTVMGNAFEVDSNGVIMT